MLSGQSRVTCEKSAVALGGETSVQAIEDEARSTMQFAFQARALICHGI